MDPIDADASVETVRVAKPQVFKEKNGGSLMKLNVISYEINSDFKLLLCRSYPRPAVVIEFAHRNTPPIQRASGPSFKGRGKSMNAKPAQ